MKYPITTKLKRQLKTLQSDLPGHSRVWVRTWDDGCTLVGIRHSNQYTLPFYEVLKAKCLSLGYEVFNEGKPGTVGYQSFQVRLPE